MEKRDKYLEVDNNKEAAGEVKYGGLWVIIGSFLGALIIGFGVLELNWKYVILLAAVGFVLLYLVLSALWGEEDDFPVDLSKDALDPPHKWLLFSLGLVLVVVSLLSSNLLTAVLSRFDPLLNLGSSWLPLVLFFLGVILVSLPLVSLRIDELGIKVKFNIGFLVFLPSLSGYMLLVIYNFFRCGPLRINRTVSLDRLNILMILLVIASGLVVVVSVILDTRARGKEDEHFDKGNEEE